MGKVLSFYGDACATADNESAGTGYCHPNEHVEAIVRMIEGFDEERLVSVKAHLRMYCSVYLPPVRPIEKEQEKPPFNPYAVLNKDLEIVVIIENRSLPSSEPWRVVYRKGNDTFFEWSYHHDSPKEVTEERARNVYKYYSRKKERLVSFEEAFPGRVMTHTERRILLREKTAKNPEAKQG